MKFYSKIISKLLYCFIITIMISSCSTEDSEYPEESQKMDSIIESTSEKAQSDCSSVSFYSNERFRSEKTQNFLTLNSDGSIRYSGGSNFMQEFNLLRVNNTNYFAIKGRNGKFLSSENGTKPATFSRTCVGEWEKFELVIAADICYCGGSRTAIVIRDKKNGKVFNVDTKTFDTPFENRSLKNVFDTYY